MKVLITGSTGFIGRNLLELSKSNTEYNEIYTVARTYNQSHIEGKHKSHFCVDLSVQSEVEYLFTRIKPDIIFHLAGEANPKINNKDINRHITININGTHNLLRFCPDGCKFIYTSSVVIYGDGRSEFPYFETDIDITKPTSLYGYSKLMGENLVDYYANRKLVGISARLCANIGLGMTHGILKDFLKKAKSDNPEFEILGDKPGSCKPYMYVLDTCSALMAIAKNIYSKKLNVCPNDNITTQEICAIVQEELRTEKPIKWLGETVNFEGDNRIINCACKELYNVTNWQPHFKTSKAAIRYVVRNSI